MGKPDKLLSNDEAVVFDVRHHPVVLWRPALLDFLVLAAWITLLATVGFFRNGWVLLAGFVVFGCVFLYSAWKVLVWSRVHLVLTDHRLIYRYGVLARHARAVPLSGINDVSSTQRVLERMLGYGDLVVQSSPEGRPTPYPYVPNPQDLKLKILEHARTAGAGPPPQDGKAIAREVALAMEGKQPTREMPPLPPERPPLYSEIVDQIERLDAMRGRGVISEEEFRRAKQGLIDRLSQEGEDAG